MIASLPLDKINKKDKLKLLEIIYENINFQLYQASNRELNKSVNYNLS